MQVCDCEYRSKHVDLVGMTRGQGGVVNTTRRALTDESEPVKESSERVFGEPPSSRLWGRGDWYYTALSVNQLDNWSILATKTTIFVNNRSILARKEDNQCLIKLSALRYKLCQ